MLQELRSGLHEAGRQALWRRCRRIITRLKEVLENAREHLELRLNAGPPDLEALLKQIATQRESELRITIAECVEQARERLEGSIDTTEVIEGGQFEMATEIGSPTDALKGGALQSPPLETEGAISDESLKAARFGGTSLEGFNERLRDIREEIRSNCASVYEDLQEKLRSELVDAHRKIEAEIRGYVRESPSLPTPQDEFMEKIPNFRLDLPPMRIRFAESTQELAEVSLSEDKLREHIKCKGLAQIESVAETAKARSNDLFKLVEQVTYRHVNLLCDILSTLAETTTLSYRPGQAADSQLHWLWRRTEEKISELDKLESRLS